MSVTVRALEFLEHLFCDSEGVGINLLRAAITGLDDPDVAAASCIELALDLVREAKKLK